MGRDGSTSPCETKEKKKKKKSKRRSSSSEDGDSDGEHNSKTKNKKSFYEIELEKFKEEHARKKDLMKANETPEERVHRRRLKKEQKELKRRQQASAPDLGYNNAYHEGQLAEAFVWKKKDVLEGRDVGTIEERRRRQVEKEEEVKIELEKVRKRKVEREAQKQAREEEAGLLQREKEALMFSSWEKQEDDFHLHQARLRSSIRIRDGRAKAIDLLASYINPDEEELEIQMHEPYTALVGLSIDDLEDLLEDIKVYITIDKKENIEFWTDITTIVKDELEKLKKKRSEEDMASRREVINPSVQRDVHEIFRGKTFAQLQLLQKQMKDRMKCGGSIDVGYWESLLQQSEAYLAKARLKESHQKFLKKKLDEMKMESNIENDKGKDESQTEEDKDDKIVESKGSDGEQQAGPSSSSDDKYQDQEDEEIDEKVELQKLTDAEIKERSIKEYYEHAYNPKLLNFTEVDQEKWMDPEDDIRKLGYLREQVKSGSTVDEELEADNLFNTQVLHGMNENEEAFNTAVVLTQKKYNWSDKYRPRKPRFFNRVHTGYEWNKYNQTHYDQDNPPPKVVQGYKFNIFYPDLIDQTATPEYTVTPCVDDNNFAVLRFKAGPPYEDIAFKIVNREWECAGRRGFKCQFNNKIFQLYFHFKRFRYRR